MLLPAVFTTKERIVETYRPGAHGQPDSIMKTLRHNGLVSPGIAVTPRHRSGRFHGHIHFYSQMNYRSARLARGGKKEQAREVAAKAEEFERLPETQELVTSLAEVAPEEFWRSTEDAIRVFTEAINRAQTARLREVWSALAERQRQQLQSVMKPFEIESEVFAEMGRQMSEAQGSRLRELLQPMLEASRSLVLPTLVEEGMAEHFFGHVRKISEQWTEILDPVRNLSLSLPSKLFAEQDLSRIGMPVMVERELLAHGEITSVEPAMIAADEIDRDYAFAPDRIVLDPVGQKQLRELRDRRSTIPRARRQIVWSR